MTGRALVAEDVAPLAERPLVELRLRDAHPRQEHGDESDDAGGEDPEARTPNVARARSDRGSRVLARRRGAQRDAALEVEQDGGRGVVPQRGVALEQLEDDVVEVRERPGPLRRRREAAHGELAREHLVEDDAQRVEIRPVIDRARALQLLGRHVVDRAHHVVGARQGVPACPGTELREAEIGDAHAARRVHEHVLGLDVAVDHALVVRVPESRADLDRDLCRAAGVDPAGLQQLAKALPVHVLHHDVVEGAGLAEVVDPDDVLVRQLRERTRLAREPLGEAGLLAELGPQDLERDPAVELLLPRLVDRAHAALADPSHDLQILGEGVQALDRRRRPAAGSRVRVGHEPGLEQAAGAEALRGVQAQRGATLRTGSLPRRPYHRARCLMLPDTGVTAEGYTGPRVANNARISSSTLSPSPSVAAISSRSACR